VYALAFLVLRNSGLSALVLLLVGLLSATTLVAVYLRLRETAAAFALWAFLLSLTGSLGAAIHGGDRGQPGVVYLAPPGVVAWTVMS
jgi:hypothetical protein